MYRAPPHSTTGVSPADFLFCRKFRTCKPESQISASSLTSDISTKRQPQPSVNGSEEHSGETPMQTAAVNTAEPDSNENIVPRTVRSRKQI